MTLYIAKLISNIEGWRKYDALKICNCLYIQNNKISHYYKTAPHRAAIDIPRTSSSVTVTNFKIKVFALSRTNLHEKVTWIG